MVYPCPIQLTTVVSMHPGTCDTDLSVPFQKNVAKGKLFEKKYAIEQMTNVLKELSIDNTGQAYDWAGEVIIVNV